VFGQTVMESARNICLMGATSLFYEGHEVYRFNFASYHAKLPFKDNVQLNLQR